MGRAVILLLGAYFMYTSMNAAAKWLGQYPTLELMFFRNLAALIPIGILVMRAGGPRIMRTRRPVGHALRASSALCAMFANYFSVALLPLGDAIALGNGTPLFITLLAIPMLSERPGIHRWGAVLVGMVGLLLIAVGLGAFRGGGYDPVAIGVAASHGVFAATSQLLVRQLSATERSETIVAWQSLLLALACGAVLPFVWVTPTWPHLALMVLIGVCGGIGQFLMTQAYASAEASAIAPWTYSGIVWAVLFGWLIWGDAPGPLMIAGSVIVAASGLYILGRERRRART